MRFLMLVKHAETVAMSGAPPPKFMEEMAKLAEGAATSGGLIASGGLAPTAASTRIRVSSGKVTALDGPFTEAKEIVGGFAMFELKSKQEAIDGATQFMELHKKFWPGWEGETEVRQIFGPEDFAPKS
jgi:hypothetical protein